jgi:hypothetical protein
MKYGLLEDVRELGAYIFGDAKVPFIQYNDGGSWEAWLPKYENQTTRSGQETSGCTVWGSQNQIETFYNYLYNKEPNYSERFTYLNVPIDPKKGTDPQKTYEAIREHGLVDESELPMTDTLAEYLDQTDLRPSLLAKGQNWLVTHDFRHEWLWDTRPDNYMDILKDALKTCPIGVSVSAWNLQGDEYVSNQGSVNNHFCMLYKIDDEGYPWIFDSYDHTQKKLSKDHNIRRAKRIWINKRTMSGARKHITLLQDILKAFKLMNKTLLDVCKENLGKDVTPKDVVSDEVACAETVTTLLKMVYPTMPIITGTYTLWQHLRAPHSNFIEMQEPEAGCIVISPTGTGKYGTTGHTGIMDENGLIMSNNSYGKYSGLFTQNYNLDTWTMKYKDRQGMPVMFYKHV